MGRPCTICAHPARHTIDTALETDRSLRDIAAQFGVSKTALHRHWRAHLVGGDPPAASNRRAPAKVKPKSRAKIIAKWALITGLGFGVLVWVSITRSGSRAAARKRRLRRSW